MSDILQKRAEMQATSTRDVDRYGVKLSQPNTPTNREQLDTLLTKTTADPMQSPSSLASPDTFHTARTFEVATQKGGRRVMSEEEVNALVHNALRRAREATAPVSPRNRTRPNPLSPRVATSFSAITSPRPPTSPSKDSSTSFSRTNPSSDSGDPYVLTTTGIDSNMSNISGDGSDFHEARSDESMEDSLSIEPDLKTVNSSEAIIRRVEEEIANARKAAQEANRRLAGVSANLRLSGFPDSRLSGFPDSSGQLMSEDVAISGQPSVSYELPNDPSDEIKLPEKPQPSEGSTGPSVVRDDLDLVDSRYDSAQIDESDHQRSHGGISTQGTDTSAEMALSPSIENQVSIMTEDSVDNVDALLDRALNGSIDNEYSTLSDEDINNVKASTAEVNTDIGAQGDNPDESSEVELLHLDSESIDKERYTVPSSYTNPEDESLAQAEKEQNDDTNQEPVPMTQKYHAEFPFQLSAQGNVIMRILAESEERPPSEPQETTYHKVVDGEGSCHEVIDLTTVESEGTHGLAKSPAQEPPLQSAESTSTSPSPVMRASQIDSERDFKLKYPVLIVEPKRIVGTNRNSTPESLQDSIDEKEQIIEDIFEMDAIFNPSSEKLVSSVFSQENPTLTVEPEEETECLNQHPSVLFQESIEGQADVDQEISTLTVGLNRETEDYSEHPSVSFQESIEAQESIEITAEHHHSSFSFENTIQEDTEPSFDASREKSVSSVINPEIPTLAVEPKRKNEEYRQYPSVSFQDVMEQNESLEAQNSIHNSESDDHVDCDTSNSCELEEEQPIELEKGKSYDEPIVILIQEDNYGEVEAMPSKSDKEYDEEYDKRAPETEDFIDGDHATPSIGTSQDLLSASLGSAEEDEDTPDVSPSEEEADEDAPVMPPIEGQDDENTPVMPMPPAEADDDEDSSVIPPVVMPLIEAEDAETPVMSLVETYDDENSSVMPPVEETVDIPTENTGSIDGIEVDRANVEETEAILETKPTEVLVGKTQHVEAPMTEQTDEKEASISDSDDATEIAANNSWSLHSHEGEHEDLDGEETTDEIKSATVDEAMLENVENVSAHGEQHEESTGEMEAKTVEPNMLETLENMSASDEQEKTGKNTVSTETSEQALWSSLETKAEEEDMAVEEKAKEDAKHAQEEPPVGLNQSDKSKAPHSSKVRFKQRYPVPPPIQRPRSVEKIAKDHCVVPSGNGLFLSKPKPDLKELLQAAVGSSLQRRSNACGALKVLTTQKKNKLTLVRTAGFLDALVFATNAKIPSHDIESATDARTRAVLTICNVCEPKDNREIIFQHPGLPLALVKTMTEDKADARTAASGCLAMLAKTPSIRESLAQTKNVLNTLASVLKGGNNEEPKPSYSGDDEGSSLQRSYSSSSESTSSSLENDSSLSNEEEETPLPRVRSMRTQKEEQTGETERRGQLNACAALLHISKQCGATALMCNNVDLMDALVEVSQREDDPKHTKCIEILCNLTRFPANTERMAKYPGLVDTLVVNGGSSNNLDRVWSLRTLQNISSDVAGKTVLANRTVLELLSYSVMRDSLEEQLAATATLYNLSTEPGAVVPLTNTKNVVATLVHVAHNPETPSSVRLMACDALATLGLWMQTLAGAGTMPKEMNENVTLPSYITSGWERWD